jgi:hypothetical protein
MSALGFVEAFAKFGAKPDNQMWAISAIAADGALVVSCWAHYFKSGGPGVMVYRDCLSRWKGNELGNGLFRTHLSQAFSKNLPVRMVVATAQDTESIDHGRDASKVKKTFHVREDAVGKVIEFDGDNFVIEFRRALT